MGVGMEPRGQICREGWRKAGFMGSGGESEG